MKYADFGMITKRKWIGQSDLSSATINRCPIPDISSRETVVMG
jgi:hypothetical protein